MRVHLRPKLLQEVQKRKRPAPSNPSPDPPTRRQSSKQSPIGQIYFGQTAVARKAEIASFEVHDRRRGGKKIEKQIDERSISFRYFFVVQSDLNQKRFRDQESTSFDFFSIPFFLSRKSFR
jgi:hypothetical protein